MAGLRSLYKAFALILVLASAGVLNAQEGLNEAFARLNSSWIAANSPFGPSVVSADFNQDKHADGAILFHQRSNFRIELHFRSHRVKAITFASDLPALALVALDVNHDGSPDLVVQDPFSRQRHFVWLNDGHGAFRAAPVIDTHHNSDSDHQVVLPPVPGEESDALLGPSKMRSRSTTAFVHQQVVTPCTASRVEIRSHSTCCADPVPNLVRGSPSLSLV